MVRTGLGGAKLAQKWAVSSRQLLHNDRGVSFQCAPSCKQVVKRL